MKYNWLWLERRKAEISWYSCVRDSIWMLARVPHSHMMTQSFRNRYTALEKFPFFFQFEPTRLESAQGYGKGHSTKLQCNGVKPITTRLHNRPLNHTPISVVQGEVGGIHQQILDNCQMIKVRKMLSWRNKYHVRTSVEVRCPDSKLCLTL